MRTYVMAITLAFAALLLALGLIRAGNVQAEGMTWPPRPPCESKDLTLVKRDREVAIVRWGECPSGPIAGQNEFHYAVFLEPPNAQTSNLRPIFEYAPTLSLTGYGPPPTVSWCRARKLCVSASGVEQIVVQRFSHKGIEIEYELKFVR